MRAENPRQAKLGRNRILRSGTEFHGKSIATLVFVPWSVFVLVAMTATMLLAYMPALVYFICVLCIGFSFFLHSLSANAPGPMYTYLGGLSVVAVFFGFMCGKIISDRHMVQYWSPVMRPVYEKVSPASPALSVHDGGTLHFAPGAQVDHEHIVGLQTPIGGNTYCVAPIRMDAQNNEVNFWAAGLDCCGHRSAFTCDDSARPGAGTGIVIIGDGSGFNVEQHRSFMMAAKQASAAYGLHMPISPMFVRWVLDKETARGDYMTQAIIYLVLWCSLYLTPSLVAAAFLHWSDSKNRGTGSPV